MSESISYMCFRRGFEKDVCFRIKDVVMNIDGFSNWTEGRFIVLGCEKEGFR